MIQHYLSPLEAFLYLQHISLCFLCVIKCVNVFLELLVFYLFAGFPKCSACVVKVRNFSFLFV